MDENVIDIRVRMQFGQMHRNNVPTEMHIVGAEDVLGVVDGNGDK